VLVGGIFCTVIDTDKCEPFLQVNYSLLVYVLTLAWLFVFLPFLLTKASLFFLALVFV